jgi:hypothetical protein
MFPRRCLPQRRSRRDALSARRAGPHLCGPLTAGGLRTPTANRVPPINSVEHVGTLRPSAFGGLEVHDQLKPILPSRTAPVASVWNNTLLGRTASLISPRQPHGSFLTRSWRETDSNRRSPVGKIRSRDCRVDRDGMSLHRKGPARCEVPEGSNPFPPPPGLSQERIP